MWPADPAKRRMPSPSLSDVIETLLDTRQSATARTARALARRARRDRPLGAAQARHRRLAHRRFGAARQDRRGIARRQGAERDRNALARPRAALCGVVRLARRPRRHAGVARSGAVPPGHAGACARGRPILPRSIPREFMAEWKWDGIRVQAVTGAGEDGRTVTRLYSRTGEDISKSFPDLAEALRLPGAIDGELLIAARRPRAVVQRAAAATEPQGRHAEAAGGVSRASARLRSAASTAREDLRDLPFAERRARLQAFVAKLERPARRSLAAGRLRHLGGTHRRARRSRHGRRGRATPRPSKASCSSAATPPTCPAGRRACGGSGSAIR